MIKKLLTKATKNLCIIFYFDLLKFFFEFEYLKKQQLQYKKLISNKFYKKELRIMN